MPKEEPVKVKGEVIETLRGVMFRVKLHPSPSTEQSVILAKASGRMQKYHIRILLGDIVDVEMSPYDLTRGRIVYRYK